MALMVLSIVNSLIILFYECNSDLLFVFFFNHYRKSKPAIESDQEDAWDKMMSSEKGMCSTKGFWGSIIQCTRTNVVEI